MEYKIVKCSSCNIYQLSTALKIFSCKNCSTKLNISKMKIYHQNNSSKIITNILIKMKQELAKDNYMKVSAYTSL